MQQVFWNRWILNDIKQLSLSQKTGYENEIHLFNDFDDMPAICHTGAKLEGQIHQ